MKIIAFFVRHGETDLNAPDANGVSHFRGDADVTLNEKGQQQAEALVPYFGAHKFSQAFISSRTRTKQTLKPLLDSKGMGAVEVPSMDSLNTGDFTGLPKTDENKEKLNWYRDNPTEVIPGGESVQHFRDRVDPAIMSAVRIGEESGRPTISSIHGSVMREISRLFHEGDYNKVKVEPGGVVGIFKTQNGYLAKPLVKESLIEEDIPAGS